MSIHVMDWYWRNSTEKSNALLLLLALADFANEDGECYPGSARLGKKSRLTKTPLKNILSKLERAGKIGIVQNAGVAYNGGKTNRYYLNEFRQNRVMDGKPAPLPVVLTETLGKRTIKPRSLKDKITLVARETPGLPGDIPPGLPGDIPPGLPGDTKPSLNPSLQPSDSFAPAAPDAQADATPDVSVVQGSAGSRQFAGGKPTKERKSSAKKKDTPAEPKPRTEEQLRGHTESARKIAVLASAYGVSVVAKADESLYLKIYHELITGDVPEDEFALYVQRVRKEAKNKWTVTLPSLTANGRITEYISARDAYRAQQTPPVVGGMQVDPEKLKQLGWN